MSEEKQEFENIEKTPEMEQIEDLMSKLDQMVEPERYAELEKKYKQLLHDYTNRRPAPKPKEKPQMRKVEEVAKELAEIKDGDVTNREYWKKSLEYRDAFMQRTGRDPWADGAGEETPKTKFVADTIKELLDQYENPVSFRTQFNEMLKDDPAVIRALANKNKKNKK